MWMSHKYEVTEKKTHCVIVYHDYAVKCHSFRRTGPQHRCREECAPEVKATISFSRVVLRPQHYGKNIHLLIDGFAHLEATYKHKLCRCQQSLQWKSIQSIIMRFVELEQIRNKQQVLDISWVWFPAAAWILIVLQNSSVMRLEGNSPGLGKKFYPRRLSPSNRICWLYDTAFFSGSSRKHWTTGATRTYRTCRKSVVLNITSTTSLHRTRPIHHLCLFHPFLFAFQGAPGAPGSPGPGGPPGHQGDQGLPVSRRYYFIYFQAGDVSEWYGRMKMIRQRRIWGEKKHGFENFKQWERLWESYNTTLSDTLV